MLLPKLDRKNRLVTMFLDHVIMTFLLFVLSAPLMVISIVHASTARTMGPSIFQNNLLFELLIFSLYFNKDIYLGQSIAKRILKFQVLDNCTGQPANPVRCLIRNLTLFLWPVEALVALINPPRRLGDFLAGTRLAVYDADLKTGPDWPLIGASVILGMLFTYLLYLPIDWLLQAMREAQRVRQ
jgi:hypothetical protein